MTGTVKSPSGSSFTMSMMQSSQDISVTTDSNTQFHGMDGRHVERNDRHGRCHMNQQPQPRMILVLPRVQRLCVSLDSGCFVDPHLHFYRPPRCDSSLYHLSLQLLRTAGNSNFANHRDLLIHIQNP